MPPVCRILAISGSLQARSGNRSLLEAARSNAPATAEVTIFDGLRALPAFDPDVQDADAPDAVAALRQAVTACDALLIASPEYGFSLPGALKNAIDWLIGSGNLESKIIGVTAAVKTAGRGQRGSTHSRTAARRQRTHRRRRSDRAGRIVRARHRSPRRSHRA